MLPVVLDLMGAFSINRSKTSVITITVSTITLTAYTSAVTLSIITHTALHYKHPRLYKNFQNLYKNSYGLYSPSQRQSPHKHFHGLRSLSWTLQHPSGLYNHSSVLNKHSHSL